MAGESAQAALHVALAFPTDSPSQGCQLAQGAERGVLGRCSELETLASQLLDF